MIIRISVVFGILASILLIISTFYVQFTQIAINILIFSEIFGGISWGLSGPAVQALIADSIRMGYRSKFFASLRFYEEVSLTLGPSIALLMTIFFGDTWNIDLLRIIIVFASLCEILSYLIASLMSDVKSFDRTNTEDIINVNFVNQENKSLDRSDKRYDLIVPLIIIISGLLIGFGAGATIVFFPVLFADPIIGYNLPPSYTYIIIGLGSITTGIMAILAQRIVNRVKNGRIDIMVLIQFIAIVCLLGIIMNLNLYLNRDLPYWTSVIFLVFLYISRVALMNASSPLSRSILMDSVPKKARAKWNSAEQLAWGMFWSVSASIGGFVVDNFGFTYVFLFTATLYTIATLILLLIRNRVPKESIQQKHDRIKISSAE